MVIGIAVNGFACVRLYFDSKGSSGGLFPWCGGIIGIPIQTYLLRWLWDNEQRFNN